VYHERRLTAASGNLSNRSIFMNSKNRYATLLKNYHFSNLSKFLPPIIGLEFLKVCALLRCKPSHAIATLGGIFWILKNIDSIFKRRLLIQKMIRKKPDSYVLKRFLRPNLLRLYRDFQKNYGRAHLC
jgi:hypothetical protein